MSRLATLTILALTLAACKDEGPPVSETALPPTDSGAVKDEDGKVLPKLVGLPEATDEEKSDVIEILRGSLSPRAARGSFSPRAAAAGNDDHACNEFSAEVGRDLGLEASWARTVRQGISSQGAHLCHSEMHAHIEMEN